MSDDELGDLDWLTWEWLVELAQSGSDNPEDGDCWISEQLKRETLMIEETYYKAVRTDGTDFYSGNVLWDQIVT